MIASAPASGLMAERWKRSYSGKVVAVTGATGFIGSRMVNRLAAFDCRIIEVTRSDWGAAAEADVIFHFAAQTSARVAEQDALLDFEANVTPMRRLLAACQPSRQLPVVVFAGTVTQAGVASTLPVNEDASDHPVTVYDRHKLMAEETLKTAARRGEIRGVSLRLSNVYGPGAHGRTRDRDVLNRMIVLALRGEPLTVYGDGGCVRDYLFIDDAVDAFLAAAANVEHVNGRYFVVGTGRGISIRDAFELVAARVGRRTGRPVAVTSTPSPAPLSAIEQRHFIADSSRFSAATGWRPTWTLRDGIDRTIEVLACV
jgi:UDP-glucose 4-epimerase